MNSPIDRIRELGGAVSLDGERLRYRIPAGDPEARRLLAEIRRDRDAVIEMLRELESQPPSLEEVRAMFRPASGCSSMSRSSRRSRWLPFPLSPTLANSSGLTSVTWPGGSNTRTVVRRLLPAVEGAMAVGTPVSRLGRAMARSDKRPQTLQRSWLAWRPSLS